LGRLKPLIVILQLPGSLSPRKNSAPPAEGSNFHSRGFKAYQECFPKYDLDAEYIAIQSGETTGMQMPAKCSPFRRPQPINARPARAD
jgi:hypothetical protein